ncbi:MAG: AAA family ATPase [Candidatus Aenigmarchaeota archaeon]|nr:AAA family ATPase [Candidatus Aenigmarchaeota archaeon]
MFYSESRIFKNEEMLSHDYLPELLPHRENQIKQIANNILPASKGRQPQNTFLFGSPGIGKTASVKYIFREFENSSGAKTVYVNCWDYKTATAVLSKIVIDLGYPIQRRGWGKDEIFNRLKEVLNKLNKGLIICLDEIDQLEQEALYDLLRLDVDIPLGLVAISNNQFVFADAEPRIRSSLAMDEVEFKPYTLMEMKDVLQERVKHSIISVEDGVVLLAANQAVQKGGDVRIGLQCLLKAGRVAEQENSNKLEVEHMRKVLKEVKEVKPEILKEKINDGEKIILEILNGGKKQQSGELYKEYCRLVKDPVSDRLFREYINHLAEVNLVKINKRKLHGSVRIISKV